MGLTTLISASFVLKCKHRFFCKSNRQPTKLGVIAITRVGVVVYGLILLCMYWKMLSVEMDEEDVSAEVISEEDVTAHRFRPQLHLI